MTISSLRGRTSHHLQSCFAGEVLTQSVGLARNPRMCHIRSKWEKRWRDKREAQGDPVGCCLFCGEDMGPGLSIRRNQAGVRRWLLKEGPLGTELPDRSSCQPCSGAMPHVPSTQRAHMPQIKLFRPRLGTRSQCAFCKAAVMPSSHTL